MVNRDTVSLSSGAYLKLSLVKFGLKYFFWLSVLIYIPIEIIFSIGFWAVRLLSFFPFLGILSGIFIFLRGMLHTSYGDWFVYLVLSAVLFAFVLLPFVLLYKSANSSFKNVALKILSSKKLKPFAIKKLRNDLTSFFPRKILLQMLAFNKEARKWVKHCFESKDRFEISVQFEDPYQFTNEHQQIYECIECNINLDKYRHFIDDNDKNDWEYKGGVEIVDGVVLKSDILTLSNEEDFLYPSDSLIKKTHKEDYRDSLMYNLGMEFAIDFWRRSKKILKHQDCKGWLGQIAYDTDELREPIKLTDNSAMYVGLEKRTASFFYIQVLTVTCLIYTYPKQFQRT